MMLIKHTVYMEFIYRYNSDSAPDGMDSIQLTTWGRVRLNLWLIHFFLFILVFFFFSFFDNSRFFQIFFLYFFFYQISFAIFFNLKFDFKLNHVSNERT